MFGHRLLLIPLLLLSACQSSQIMVPVSNSRNLPIRYEAVGYGTLSQFKKYPMAQRRLLAMRAAKLDAYRSIVEEVYGTRVKGHTTIKDMVIENDNYRTYFDSVVRGIHLLTITPKGDGIYEAEVELKLSQPINQCLQNLNNSCSLPAYKIQQAKSTCITHQQNVSQTTYPLAEYSQACLNCNPDCLSMAFPQVIYYAD